VWRRLGLPEILAEAGMPARALALTDTMALNRPINPSSEHTMPAWRSFNPQMVSCEDDDRPPALPRKTCVHQVGSAMIAPMSAFAAYRHA